MTPSATFGERRTYECLLETNPLLVIDFDDTKRSLESFKQYPWVVGAGESVLSQNALIEPNNQVRVIASRDPQPGNWLKLPRQSYLEFTLTLFSPASSVKSGNAAVPLPQIVKEACS